MALTVKLTDSEFPKLVQGALAKMCGCQSVAVDPVTGRVSIGAMSCSCYCDHRAGCNLLTDLVNDPRLIPVFRSADSSGYEAGEVWWFPVDEDFSDDDVCGGTKISASILLAHELVHAHFDSYDEDIAVRGENQVRLERCMPMRMEYSNETVADFRVGVLDSSNRPEYGCECSAWRGGFCATFQRMLCILHSMYCIPNSFNSLWTFKWIRRVPWPRPVPSGPEMTPLELTIARALRVRARIPMADQVDHSEPLLPDADWEVALEHVGLHGVYRALLIAVSGAEVKMLTNFVLQPGQQPYLANPGATLALSGAVSQPLADSISARLSQLQFSDGEGGPTDASDGSVHFLKLGHGQQQQRVALYFHHYPATSNQWTRPGGVDGPRWDAINAIYEIWRDIVTNPAVNPSPP
jgi:hypothetical protein